MESFLANRNAIASSRATLAPASPDRGADFRPLFEAAPAINASRMPAIETREPSSQIHLEAPQVRVIEENGRVVKIVVTCRCCEEIEVECAY